MAFSGMEAYKFLPKIDCQCCGFRTCYLFAMKLANNEVSLNLCHKITDEARRILSVECRQDVQTRHGDCGL